MRKESLFVGAVCLSVVLSSTAVWGAEQESPEAATGQAATEHAATEHAATEHAATEQAAAEQAGTEAAGAGLASMNWSDFTVAVNGTVISFPTTFEALAPLGLENDDDPAGVKIEPNQYNMLYLKLGKGEIRVQFTNLDINVLPAEQTVVTGIDLDSAFLDEEPVQIELPGGIKYGESTVEDIENAYGKASDVYESDLYTELTYEQDIYNTVELTVDKETGKLDSISIENIKEPENMQKGEASTEVPAKVAAYVLPDKLSDDLNAYEIQVEGTTYKLPVPVSVMIADGWTMVTDSSDGTIPAKYFGWVTLSKNNQSLREIVWNHEEYATIPENCWLGSISLGLQDTDLEGSLPGGIHVGMTKDECEKILKDSGVEYEMDDSSSSFLHYSYGDAYDRIHEISIYTSDDGTYPQNTVLTIHVENNEVD